MAFQPIDLVLLEEKLDATGEFADRLGLSLPASGRGSAQRQ